MPPELIQLLELRLSCNSRDRKNKAPIATKRVSPLSVAPIQFPLVSLGSMFVRLLVARLIAEDRTANDVQSRLPLLHLGLCKPLPDLVR